MVNLDESVRSVAESVETIELFDLPRRKNTLNNDAIRSRPKRPGSLVIVDGVPLSAPVVGRPPKPSRKVSSRAPLSAAVSARDGAPTSVDHAAQNKEATIESAVDDEMPLRPPNKPVPMPGGGMSPPPKRPHAPSDADLYQQPLPTPPSSTEAEVVESSAPPPKDLGAQHSKQYQVSLDLVFAKWLRFWLYLHEFKVILSFLFFLFRLVC